MNRNVFNMGVKARLLLQKGETAAAEKIMQEIEGVLKQLEKN